MLWHKAQGAGGVGGGAIEFVGQMTATGYNTASPVANLTTLSGGVDTAAREGDFVLALLFMSVVDNSPRGRGIIKSGDYTYLLQAVLVGDGITDAFLTVGYKFMGAIPDTSITVSQGLGLGAEVLQARVYRGVNTQSPIDVFPVTSNAKPVNPPPISPSAGSLVIAGGGISTHGQSTSSALLSPDLDAFHFSNVSIETNDAMAGWGHSTEITNPAAFSEVVPGYFYDARAACTFSINPA